MLVWYNQADGKPTAIKADRIKVKYVNKLGYYLSCYSELSGTETELPIDWIFWIEKARG